MTSVKVAGVVSVLGGGAYGTALAQHLARKGTSVQMWVLEEDTARSINERHENDAFLKGVALNPLIRATLDVREAVQGTDMVLLVIPTPFIRRWLQAHHPVLPVGVPLVCCSKGIENGTHATPYDILVEEMPGKYHKHLAALSGPSFAMELANGKPTNVTVAAVEDATAHLAQAYISNRDCRVYTCRDVIGTELCGALKNVIAIASGASDGFEFGSNGRAALISRGLAEITRLIVKKGGQASTVMGLAGVGDLVLTCSSTLSRNYSVGHRLARGESVEQILSGARAVAEGVKTSQSVYEMAQSLDVDMPIANEVYLVIHKKKPIKAALQTLQARPLRSEDERFEFRSKM